MILSAFAFPSFAWLFIWGFISLFAVSIVYAFGLNGTLAGEHASPNIWQWILFSPYFAGNWLSWQYYRRKLSLVTKVENGVYLGRLPAKHEYDTLKTYNISHVVNLATEQQFHTFPLSQTRLPFLDQTIPSPEALHEGVLLIESMKKKGVYVHCALGLSRSVLLISAWYLYLGYTLEQIDTLMAKIRPNYVKSPYMRIALELYLQYLKQELTGLYK
jgi:protein-tyrosine phosphatase